MQYVIAIHVIRWLTNFYDFRFKWTATLAIGIHPTKAWLSQLVNFKNAIWMWGHLKEWYAIEFCFKLGKNVTETYGMLQTAFGASCMNRAWVFEWHKRLKEGRESVRDDERCGMRGLLCWGFKGVQKEIPSEEACTLQNGSVAFPPEQCTSPHQSTTLSLSLTIWPRWASRQFFTLSIVQTMIPVTFGYSLSSEAVIMRELGLKRLWQRSLTRSHKKIWFGLFGFMAYQPL